MKKYLFIQEIDSNGDFRGFSKFVREEEAKNILSRHKIYKNILDFDDYEYRFSETSKKLGDLYDVYVWDWPNNL